MHTTYIPKQPPAQKKDAPSASSVFDSSSQSESLQRKADMANNATQRAEAPRPNNTGMPDNLKAGIESLSGFSMDDVRVHYNSSKPATVQALAYTQGTDIHVAPGQEKCLPHEAWHVAQQMAGRVSPTTNVNGMPVNDNAALEHEANVMGAKAVQCKKNNEVIRNCDNLTAYVSQMMPGGDVDLVCAADVIYYDSKKKLKKVKGSGCNDASTASDVLKTFEKYGLKKLSAGNYKKTNPPGQCAEPHAVENALKKIPILESENVDVSSFKEIYVSDAVVRKYNSETKGKKDPYGSGEVKDNSGVLSYIPCDTCKEWINGDGRVKDSYLEKDGGLSETASDATVYEEEFPNVLLYKPTKGYRLKNSSDARLGNYYHNLNFSNLIKENAAFENFKDDEELKNIAEKKGMRTVIKKQMLKNRVLEILKGKDEIKAEYENDKQKIEGDIGVKEKECKEYRANEKLTLNTLKNKLSGCALKSFLIVFFSQRLKNDKYDFKYIAEVFVPDELKKMEKKLMDTPPARVKVFKTFVASSSFKEKIKVDALNTENFNEFLSNLYRVEFNDLFSGVNLDQNDKCLKSFIEKNYLDDRYINELIDSLKVMYDKMIECEKSIETYLSAYRENEKKFNEEVAKRKEYVDVCNAIEFFAQSEKDARRDRNLKKLIYFHSLYDLDPVEQFTD